MKTVAGRKKEVNPYHNTQDEEGSRVAQDRESVIPKAASAKARLEGGGRVSARVSVHRAPGRSQPRGGRRWSRLAPATGEVTTFGLETA